MGRKRRGARERGAVGLVLLGGVLVGGDLDAAPCPVRGEPGGGLGRIEASFDDADDGTGYMDGFESIDNPEGPAELCFVDGARRTGIGAGRYGRGAALGGGAQAIEVIDRTFRPADGLEMTVWLTSEGPADGWLFRVDRSFGLRFAAGELQVAVYDADTRHFAYFPSGVTVPDDGAYHHLHVVYAPGPGESFVEVTLDFGHPVLALRPVPNVPVSSAVPQLGWRLVGTLDDLLLTEYGSFRIDYDFDSNPAACGDGSGRLECLEETIVTTPTGFGRAVPVRMKSLYDPELCTPDGPCPLTVVVSGGGVCNDDYTREAVALARAGLMSVTVDPHCEATAAYSQFPSETSQLVAAKDFLMGSSALAPRIRDGAYYAVGCSHGGRAVGLWLLREADHPSRAFLDSAGNLAPHCAYHFGGMCPVAQQDWDRAFGLSTPHQESLPQVSSFNDVDLVNYVDSSTVVSREVLAVWGTNTTTPASQICPSGCLDAGTGHRHGGRLFRDVWQALELPGLPTGLFVENSTRDCQHCISSFVPANEPLMACVQCFLLHGRGAMAAECPSCLDLGSGGSVPSCPIRCEPGHGCTVGEPEPLPIFE